MIELKKYLSYLYIILLGAFIAWPLVGFLQSKPIKTRHCAYTNERYEMPSKYTGHCVCIYDEGYVMLERCEKE
jgi:hypothetical protein